jgi:pimeloyl-ACP methyl ester carboxylesterase
MTLSYEDVPMPILDLAGIPIHYRVDGAGERTFLLFNGATVPLTFWGERAMGLPTLGRVVRFDPRGVGASGDGPAPFSLGDVAADARALLDHLRIERAILVGHAWGGRVAQVFARDYPERSAALIVCSTGGHIPATGLEADREAMAAAERAGDRAAWDAAAARVYCAPGLHDRDPALASELLDHLWQGRRSSARIAAASRLTPSATYWGTARCPALLLYGRHDRQATEANARDLHAHLPDARLVFIEDAAHLVVREQPERILAEVRRFLEEQGL